MSVLTYSKPIVNCRAGLFMLFSFLLKRVEYIYELFHEKQTLRLNIAMDVPSTAHYSLDMSFLGAVGNTSPKSEGECPRKYEYFSWEMDIFLISFTGPSTWTFL